MPYELCRHIKTNGHRCHSPALTGDIWCYFHARLTHRQRQLRAAKPEASKPAFSLPTLVDREACQVSVSLVAEAILTGAIDNQCAGLLLRAINLASRNIGSDGGLRIEPYAPDIVRSFTPMSDGITLAPRSMSDHSAPPKPAPIEPLAEQLVA